MSGRSNRGDILLIRRWEMNGPTGQELSPIEVRRADGRDMEALLAIEQQCFNVYYYDYYMLDRRDFEFYLQDTDSLFLVAAQGTHVIGDILGPVDSWRSPHTSTASPCGRRPKRKESAAFYCDLSRERSAGKAARG